MPVSAERFRRVLGHLAGGVAVVTSRDARGRPFGMTATAVCSVSLEPPLVLACLDVGTTTHRVVESSGLYAVNLLAGEHTELAVRFAALSSGRKFEGLPFAFGPSGAPLLDAALAWCECRVVRTVPAGDHTIFLGAVEHADVRRAGEPLVYYRGRYGTLREGSGGERAPRTGPARPEETRDGREPETT